MVCAVWAGCAAFAARSPPMRDTIEAAPGVVETSRIGQRRSLVPLGLVPQKVLGGGHRGRSLWSSIRGRAGETRRKAVAGCRCRLVRQGVGHLVCFAIAPCRSAHPPQRRGSAASVSRAGRHPSVTPSLLRRQLLFRRIFPSRFKRGPEVPARGRKERPTSSEPGRWSERFSTDPRAVPGRARVG